MGITKEPAKHLQEAGNFRRRGGLLYLSNYLTSAELYKGSISKYPTPSWPFGSRNTRVSFIGQLSTDIQRIYL